MSRWRVSLVLALLVLPFAALAGVGTYYLWQRGLMLYVWWPLAACMALGYLLGWHWQRKQQLLRAPRFEVLPRWTERDAQAWKLVEARAKAAAGLPIAKLSEVAHYLEVGQAMAQELATFYHPGAKDPIGNLTVPEVLAVVELASHDLAELVDKHLPGGHLMTINDWKRARSAVGWYNTASNVYWMVAALFDPVQTGLKYAVSRLGIAQPWQKLQENLFLWFYTAYLHRLGTYLIELHSGRLRVGADRFCQLFGGLSPAAEEALVPAGVAAPPAVPDKEGGEGPGDEAVDRVAQLTVTLIGQTKAGKSSVVNALLGEQRARTDVLPATSGTDRYELRVPGVPTKLVLLDTVGYGHSGARADQMAATRDAARESDLVFLVLHALSPGRQADLDMVRDLRAWFGSLPELKRPPVLAVVTHVDLLSPAMEWAPPYDWAQGKRPKEAHIREALAAVREQLGDEVAGVVPVCTAPGKVWGIEEGLLPAVAKRLDESHAVALLRCLRAEVNKDLVRKVFRQLLATGKEAARIAWEKAKQI
jgi:predicted GTPase